MQTFTPYSDFEGSLRALDLKRLGKQRVEVIQIVRALTVPGYAWSSHPAVLMWKGVRGGAWALRADLVRGVDRTRVRRLLCCDDRCRPAGRRDRRDSELRGTSATDALPPWLFDEAVQLSHRSSLLRKDPEHYGPLFPPDTPRDLDYVWPVRSPAVIERELRKEENARRRAQRTAEKLVQEMERGRKKRSSAAKRGWKTRLEKAKREAERLLEKAGE